MAHITLSPIAGPVTVRVGELTLGTSRNALELREGSYPPVIYIPRADIDMGQLEKTARATACPWKGQASYYSIRTQNGPMENAVWSYETPKDEVKPIRGHLAFYPDRVTITRG